MIWLAFFLDLFFVLLVGRIQIQKTNSTSIEIFHRTYRWDINHHGFRFHDIINWKMARIEECNRETNKQDTRAHRFCRSFHVLGACRKCKSSCAYKISHSNHDFRTLSMLFNVLRRYQTRIQSTIRRLCNTMLVAMIWYQMMTTKYAQWWITMFNGCK